LKSRIMAGYGYQNFAVLHITVIKLKLVSLLSY
jgi:hypothetical protein